jgi:mono/diheme cytochrome c family protein
MGCRLFAVIALTCASVAAQAQEAGDPRRGLGYVQRMCADCHAVLAHETVSPVAKARPFKAIANTPGMTATALTVWFRTSHPTMPNLIIEQDDADDVIAYILGLRDKK